MRANKKIQLLLGIEYNEWKQKQEKEEKRLAEQYGMPYGEEVDDAQE